MPTQVQIDGIGTVELDDSFKTKSPAEQDGIVQNIAAQHAAQTAPAQTAPAASQQPYQYPAGDSRNLPATMTISPSPASLPRVTRQPTTMDRIMASPAGRLIHDAVVAPVEGAVSQAANALPAVASMISSPASAIDGTAKMLAGMGYTPLTSAATNTVEQPYQDALAANRNTPGYAAARQQADKSTPTMSMGDMFTAPANSAIAGTAGGLFGGSWDAANAAADAQTASQTSYATRHPLLSTIGGLAGGLAMGVPKAAAALPIYAGDSATLTQLAHGPVTGPLPRNPATAPLPVPPLNLPQLTPQVANRATRYVGNLASSAGMTPTDIAQAGTAAAGKPMFGAEAIGQPAVTGLAALGRRDGLTGDALQGALDERNAAAPDRVLSDYASASGVDPAAAAGDIQTVVANGRAAVKPMFDAALSNPTPVWNPDLARLSQRPVIKQAMSLAADDLRNADRNPLALGLNPDADAAGLTDGSSAGVGTSQQPTAEAWDLVKKNLNGMVDRDGFGRLIPDTQSRGNYNIGVANKDLTAALRDAVPGYGAALDKSGDYLSLNKAFSTGQDFILNPSVTAAQVRDHVSGLSDAEAQAFKGGVANKLFNQAQNGALSLKLFNRPIVQQKLSAVLGPQNAATFLSNVKTEAQLAQSGARMRPGNGSPTAELNAAMASQDGVNPAVGLGLDTAQNVWNHGLIPGIAKTGIQKLTGLADAYRTRGMSVPVRDASGALLMLPPDQLAAHLQQYSKLPRTNAVQAPRLPANGVRPYGLFGSGFQSVTDGNTSGN